MVRNRLSTRVAAMVLALSLYSGSSFAALYGSGDTFPKNSPTPTFFFDLDEDSLKAIGEPDIKNLVFGGCYVKAPTQIENSLRFLSNLLDTFNEGEEGSSTFEGLESTISAGQISIFYSPMSESCWSNRERYPDSNLTQIPRVYISRNLDLRGLNLINCTYRINGENVELFKFFDVSDTEFVDYSKRCFNLLEEINSNLSNL